MKWPWKPQKEVIKATEANKKEIDKVKNRLDDIEAIDIIAEELAVLQRNGG